MLVLVILTFQPRVTFTGIPRFMTGTPYSIKTRAPCVCASSCRPTAPLAIMRRPAPADTRCARARRCGSRCAGRQAHRCGGVGRVPRARVRRGRGTRQGGRGVLHDPPPGARQARVCGAVPGVQDGAARHKPWGACGAAVYPGKCTDVLTCSISSSRSLPCAHGMNAAVAAAAARADPSPTQRPPFYSPRRRPRRYPRPTRHQRPRTPPRPRSPAPPCRTT
ncbi:hypothetical protein BC834DRAFT_57709 [Gloeopeniophorella convolvens]|nr:hypothetical protein BC834DRAFT_57709 [Gloeopeniophorella convolvens]